MSWMHVHVHCACILGYYIYMSVGWPHGEFLWGRKSFLIYVPPLAHKDGHLSGLIWHFAGVGWFSSLGIDWLWMINQLNFHVSAWQNSVTKWSEHELAILSPLQLAWLRIRVVLLTAMARLCQWPWPPGSVTDSVNLVTFEEAFFLS